MKLPLNRFWEMSGNCLAVGSALLKELKMA